MGKTLLDKIWDAHTVRTEDGGRSVLYIDRQYIHEVTSPVAFAGLEPVSYTHLTLPTKA